MHTLRLTLLLLVTLTLATAHAAPFRYEVQADYTSDDADLAETDAWQVSGRYFFAPIDDGAGPLAEAAFLRPASNLGLRFRDASTDVTPPMPVFVGPTLSVPSTLPAPITLPPLADGFLLLPAAVSPATLPAGPGREADTQTFAARYEFVSPSRWVASLEIAASDGDSQQFQTTTDSEETLYEARIGKYLGATTTLTLGFRYTDGERVLRAPILDCTIFGPCTFEPGPPLVSNSRQRQWRLSGRHLQPAGNLHYVLQAAATYGVASLDNSLPDSPTPFILLAPALRVDSYGVSVSGTLYPRTDVGVGLGVDYNDSEGASATGVSLRAEWFVTPALALSGRIGRVNADTGFGLDGDTDSVSLGVRGRF